MHPILGRFGPFFVYSYTVVMAIGLAAAIGLTAWLEHRDKDKKPGRIDALIVALLVAVVGGRAGFVIANQTYFAEKPGEIGLVWLGGLSYHGALLAGLLALFAFATWKRQSFIEYAGLLAPALVLVSAFGWLACLLEGCAYGREATFGFLASDLPDTYGVFGLRYQTQLMGMVLCLALFPLIVAGRKRLRPGVLFGIGLALLSAIRVVVSLFRGDEVPAVGSLRWDTLLDGSLAAVVALVLVMVLVGRVIARRTIARRTIARRPSAGR